MAIMKQVIILFLICYAGMASLSSESSMLQIPQGNWTDMFQAQPEIKDDPSQYFMCGFGFQQMKWVKPLYNCKCKSVVLEGRYYWQCQWCNNTLWTMSNGLKIIFCHTNDWSKQIVKTFQTGNKLKGGWRQYKCPVDYYATKATARFGQEHDTVLGLNGMMMVCQNLKTKQTAQIQDTYGYELQQMANTGQDKYISGFKVKSIKDGKLTGIHWFFQSIPVVSSISITSNQSNITGSVTKTIIQSIPYSNSNYLQTRKSFTFSKSYTTVGQWKTDSSYLKYYEIPNEVRAKPLKIQKQDYEDSIYYAIIEDKFRFDENISTLYKPIRKPNVVVPPFVGINVVTFIQERSVSVPYEVEITFSNKSSGQEIKRSKYKGTFVGVMTSPIITDIQIYPTYFNMPFVPELKWIPQANKPYKISSVLNRGMVFDCSKNVNDLDNLITWPLHGLDHQRFIFKQQKDNNYSISTVFSNRSLLISGQSQAIGARLTARVEKKGLNQYFQLIPANYQNLTNAFYIKTFSGKVLNILGGVAVNDAKIVQSDYTGKQHQIFIFEAY